MVPFRVRVIINTLKKTRCTPGAKALGNEEEGTLIHTGGRGRER